MKNRFYKICQECGAHLDPGEKCDCLETGEQLILPDLPVINKDASASNLLKESEREWSRPIISNESIVSGSFLIGVDISGGRDESLVQIMKSEGNRLVTVNTIWGHKANIFYYYFLNPSKQSDFFAKRILDILTSPMDIRQMIYELTSILTDLERKKYDIPKVGDKVRHHLMGVTGEVESIWPVGKTWYAKVYVDNMGQTFFEPAKNWVVIEDHISKEETNVKSKT